MKRSNYYQELLSSVDIAEIARDHLKITDEDNYILYCDCPQHASQSQRSLHVNRDSQLWHCFGCDKGGDALHLLEFIKHGVVTKGAQHKVSPTHRDARDTLAKIVGRPILEENIPSSQVSNLADFPCDPDTTFQCLTAAMTYYHNRLMADEEVRDWLFTKYAFQDETIERFKIGYAVDSRSNPLKEFLKAQGFSEEEILSTGLFLKGESGKTVPFFNHRITFPYWSHETTVTYVAARKTPWTHKAADASKYKKLPTYHPTKRSHVNPCINNDMLFNEHCLKQKPSRVLIPEGMPDILSVLETGEAAISPITVRLKKADRDRMVRALKGLDVPVILVPDNELSRVGFKGAMSVARLFQRNDIDSRIAILPLDEKQRQARQRLQDDYGISEQNVTNKDADKDRIPEDAQRIATLIKDSKTDANEYLMKHSYEEFKAIIDAAQTPVEILIDGLSPKLKDYALKQALKPILEDLAIIDPVRQDHYLNTLKKKTGLPMGTLRQYLKNIWQEQYGSEEDKETPFQKLCRIFDESGSEVFLDQHSAGWVRMRVETHWENLRIESPAFRRKMLRAYVEEEGTSIGRETLTTFGDYLEAQAEEHRSLHNRFAWIDDKLYVDLCTPNWECVEVTPDGWSIVTLERPPFKRFSHQQPIPRPVEGGDVWKILDYVPVKKSVDQTLFIVWLSTCPIEHVARPGLMLDGVQGAGKSSCAEHVRLVVDPSTILTVSLSKDLSEFIQLMDHHALVNLDNLSGLPNWAGDALCRAVTGSGFQKRALYTNDDDFTYEFRRTFILNGIGIPSVAPDLLDRSIIIHLERIPTERRMEKEALVKAFEQDRPQILGGILDALSKAMKVRPTIQLTQMPRMADWFRWGCAVAPALGIPQEQFETAYYNNIGFQHHEVIQSEPVSETLMELMDERSSWIGPKSELYTKLTSLAEEKKIGKKRWPQNTSSLMRKLNTLSHNLAEVGIMIKEDRDGKSRHITIKRNDSESCGQEEERNSSLSSDPNVSGNAVIRVMPSFRHENKNIRTKTSVPMSSLEKAMASPTGKDGSVKPCDILSSSSESQVGAGKYLHEPSKPNYPPIPEEVMSWNESCQDLFFCLWDLHKQEGISCGEADLRAIESVNKSPRFAEWIN